MPATATVSALPSPASAPVSAIVLYAQPSPDYAAKLQATLALLRQAAAQGPVTQASSLGAEDMVLTDLIDRNGLSIGIFVLDTGALHAETLALLDRLQARQAAHPHAPLTVYQPDAQAVAGFVAREGQDAMYRGIELRKACCGIRKLEPLAHALAGQRGWITGLRREQSGARADVPAIDHGEEPTRGLTKYNPLADWTWGDVWHYIATNDVDYNPLHDRFYPSIGCAPCTRAITLGEDFRAGRWWWENEEAKECGLHVKPHSGAIAPLPTHSSGSASGVPAAVNFAAGKVKNAPASDQNQNEKAKECGLCVKTMPNGKTTQGETP